MTEPDTDKAYDPNKLIDTVIDKMELKNDAAVARLLKVDTRIIDKIRNKVLPLGGYLFIQMRDVTGMSISDLQALMGDRRRKLRMGAGRNRPNAA